MQIEKQDQGSNRNVIIIVFKLIMCGKDIEEKHMYILSFGRRILSFTNLLLLENECPMKSLFQTHFKLLIKSSCEFYYKIYVLDNPTINHCKCQAQENVKEKKNFFSYAKKKIPLCVCVN